MEVWSTAIARETTVGPGMVSRIAWRHALFHWRTTLSPAAGAKRSLSPKPTAGAASQPAVARAKKENLIRRRICFASWPSFGSSFSSLSPQDSLSVAPRPGLRSSRDHSTSRTWWSSSGSTRRSIWTSAKRLRTTSFIGQFTGRRARVPPAAGRGSSRPGPPSPIGERLRPPRLRRLPSLVGDEDLLGQRPARAVRLTGGTGGQHALRDPLRSAMEKERFTVEPNEWWHFNCRDWRQYPILDIPFEKIAEDSGARRIRPEHNRMIAALPRQSPQTTLRMMPSEVGPRDRRDGAVMLGRRQRLCGERRGPSTPSAFP